MSLCLCGAVIVLCLSGCNLPGHDPSAVRSIQEATIAAAVSETAFITEETQTPIPTETLPSPLPASATPVPITSTATFGPSPTPTLGPEFFHGSLWYDPGFVSQEGLRYNGRLISTGCTAASVQMVLDFWYTYNEDYETISAQALIDQNVRQGRFDPSTGLNIMDTEDDLGNIGYYLGMRQNSDKNELLTALERYGPLLVLTKVEWTPFGANHMAVVTGYDTESDIIRLLDPWQFGGIMEIPFENFDGIWSLNYLDDETDILQRTFFFIVPFAELRDSNEPFIPWYVLQSIHNDN